MTHPLQTKQWGEFRREWGNDVYFDKNFLIIFSKIPFTKFTIGTILKCSTITGSDLALARKIGKNKNAIFIKFEPNILYNTEVVKKYKGLGLKEGKKLFTPTTFVINLNKSEDELLKSFSSKTRYNIRLAERKGVVIKEDNSDKSFNEYLRLTLDTSKRQGFYAHNERYHRLMWKILRLDMSRLRQAPIAHLLTATYKKEIISTWILFVYDKFLYYPYGASSDKHKNVMANNLMMWEAIKFGKKLGCTSFDLWGREEGKGFTKFKEGYNPQVVEFIGSWDLIIKPALYRVYQILDNLRWFVLHLKANCNLFRVIRNLCRISVNL